jgi:hypothetical protein
MDVFLKILFLLFVVIVSNYFTYKAGEMRAWRMVADMVQNKSEEEVARWLFTCKELYDDTISRPK